MEDAVVERKLQRVPVAQGWVLKDKEEFSRWIRRLENERLKERDVRCLRVIKNTDIWADESSL